MKVEEIILLGTGTSNSVPNIPCLLRSNPSCKVCLSTLPAIDPSYKQNPLYPLHQSTNTNSTTTSTTQFYKNRRRNTSCLIRWRHSSGALKTLVIDVGKTFYEGALQWFTYYGLSQIDSVILTHGHADAMNGLDDLRSWTLGGPTRSLQESINVYCSERTLETVERTFPYIVDKAFATGGGDIPSLSFHTISETEPFVIDDELVIQPIRVHHGVYNNGDPFYCLGFRINDMVYISDANAIPQESRQHMFGAKLVVMDALHIIPHASHFSVSQALKEVLLIQPDLEPEMVFFTGFSHRVDHDELDEELGRFLEKRVDGVKEGEQKYITFSEEEWGEVREKCKVLPKILKPAWDGMRLVRNDDGDGYRIVE